VCKVRYLLCSATTSHAGNFGLGRREVVGLAGDPDQAYARELAEQGFPTIARDAIGFNERSWSPDGRSNVSWFELATRLVHGSDIAGCLFARGRCGAGLPGVSR
jgi:hypothetical protein